MEVNSINMKIKSKPTAIDLFVGVEGLESGLKKAAKSYCVRFCEDGDGSFWDMFEKIPKKAKKVYLPVWEDEMEATLTPKENTLEKLNLEFPMNPDTAKDNIRLTKACLYRNIIRYFRSLGCPCEKDFIGGIEVYIKEPVEGPNYWTYQRYGLTLRYNDQVKDEWQMDVAQGSKAIVGKIPINQLEALRDEHFNVIAGTMVMKNSEIKQSHVEKTNGRIYPIANRSIKAKLGIPKDNKLDANKYVTKYNGIRNFIAKWINTPAFVDAVCMEPPYHTQFIQVPTERINAVDENAKKLIFGNNQIGISPGYCFKKYGAAKRPAEHCHFFICPHSLSHALWRLYYIFQQGKDSIGSPGNRLDPNDIDPDNYLYHTIWMGNHAWAKGMNFRFTDDDHALAELKEHLKSTIFEHGKKYFAIIISDIRKNDIASSPHTLLYYHMKHLLMEYNIGSQVILADSIGSPVVRNGKTTYPFIDYSVPNIAAAIAGKEGGKAWKIAYPSQKNDMVIGIGAYKEHGIQQQYIGAAVCLDKEGELHNFDACLKGNFEELRASLINAILHFYGKFSSPSRLIIYYHKTLNHDESNMIEDALRTCQVSCPVIVINVTETSNNELVVFDTSCPDVLMPISGTYVHLRTRKGCHEYLLYNNERYANYGGKFHLKPFPVKISITTGKGSKQVLTDMDIREIITLTYQTMRINWKSVSMSSMPVPVAYAKLVAKFVPHFPDGQLTEFGKNNLWML